MEPATKNQGFEPIDPFAPPEFRKTIHRTPGPGRKPQIMILADTTIWVEFLKGHQPYLEQMGQLLEERQILAVEPVFGELLQGAKDDRERRVLTGYWENLPKMPVRDAWIKAGDASSRNKWLDQGIGLIDAVLIVCARECKAKIWTLDKKLKGVLNKTEIFE